MVKVADKNVMCFTMKVWYKTIDTDKYAIDRQVTSKPYMHIDIAVTCSLLCSVILPAYSMC